MRFRIVFTFLFLAFPLVAGAQTQNGRLWGNVVDSSGGVVPGATVKVTNVGTNLAKTAVADERGRFVVTDLPPATYEVSAELTGFKKFVQGGILLRVADSLEILIKLEVGNLSETVNVTSETPLLNTTTSSLGEVVENRAIMELPLNGRQTLSLVTLVPGVAPNRQMENAAQPFNRAGNFSISGARGNTNELLLDGAPNTVPEGSTGAMVAVAVFPSVDATQEFKVQSNSYSAEYGRAAGGVVNIVTKSGTNSIHGTAYEFLRNSVLDANNFFNNKSHIPLASFQRNQFGGTIGGPLFVPKLYNGKNRSFFFFSWESLLERGGRTFPNTVPTAKELSGDFSETFNSSGSKVIIYDPLSTTYNPTTKIYSRTPFPNNIIPSTRIDPIMKKTLAYFPAPLSAGDAYTHATNFVKSQSVPINDHKFDIRIDHQISPKQSLFGRFSFGNRTFSYPNLYGNIADVWSEKYPSNYRSVSLGTTYSISPTYLLDLKYSYNYLYFAQFNPSLGYNLTELGFPQYMYDNSQAHVFPRFTFVGYDGFGSRVNYQFGKQESHAALMSLSRMAGGHVMKIGSEMKMNRASRFANSRAAGGFDFDRVYTQGPNATVASTTAGNAIAAALLGVASAGTLNIAANPATQNWYDGFYFQDDWRMTTKLTLNLGLRYDLEFPFTERFNNISWFDREAASPIASQVPGMNLKGAVLFASDDRRTPWTVDKNNFAPRVGLAYQIAESLVIRTGYGLFYAPHPYGTSDGIGVGFSASNPYVASIDGANPVGKLSDPYPNGFVPVLGSAGGPQTNIGLAMSWYDLVAVTPYFQQWNLNVQKKFGTTWVVEAAYGGTKGSNLQDGGGFAVNQIPSQLMGADTRTLVPNPFYGIIKVGTLAAPQVTKGQLLSPHPQYTSLRINVPSAASSIYHSFQAKVNKRFSGGFSFLVSYTASKLIDDNSGASSWLEPTTSHQDFYNRRADRTISDQDISQRMVTSFNYALPFGKSAKIGRDWSPIVDGFLGGWQVNGIVNFQTGIPLALTTSNNSFSNNIILRPNNNGSSGKLEADSSSRIDKYFKTENFIAPLPYTFGNTSRTLPDVRGPGLSNLDFSLFKSIKISEGRSVQFRTEFFNLTNTPEFDVPDTALQSPTYGKLLVQRNKPRQIQFGLKIIF